VLDVSVKTVKNDWRFAKAWLKTDMDSGPARPNTGKPPGGDSSFSRAAHGRGHRSPTHHSGSFTAQPSSSKKSVAPFARESRMSR
jgi:hypothetical protein